MTSLYDEKEEALIAATRSRAKVSVTSARPLLPCRRKNTTVLAGMQKRADASKDHQPPRFSFLEKPPLFPLAVGSETTNLEKAALPYRPRPSNNGRELRGVCRGGSGG